MNITTAQVFLIGNLILGVFTGAAGAALLNAYHLGPDTTGAIVVTAGTLLSIWNGLGTILTKPSDQLASVVSHADEPKVQTALVTTVANYTGVESVKTNEHASQELKELAANPDVPKVVSPSGS